MGELPLPRWKQGHYPIIHIYAADGRLTKIEVEAVKVNMDSAIIPNNPILFSVWESLRPWLKNNGDHYQLQWGGDGNHWGWGSPQFPRGDWGEEVKFKKLAIYNRFQHMDSIDETTPFKNVLPRDARGFGYLRLYRSIIYNGQGGYLGKISHEGRNVNIIKIWGDSQEPINDVGNVK